MIYELNTNGTKTCEDEESILAGLCHDMLQRFSKQKSTKTFFRLQFEWFFVKTFSSREENHFHLFQNLKQQKKRKENFFKITRCHESCLVLFSWIFSVVLRQSENSEWNASRKFSSRFDFPFWCPDDVIGKHKQRERWQVHFASIAACLMLCIKALLNVWKHRHMSGLRNVFPIWRMKNLIVFCSRSTFEAFLRVKSIVLVPNSHSFPPALEFLTSSEKFFQDL